MPDVGFATVLQRRQSVRRFDSPSRSDLLALMTHAARCRFAWFMENGQIASSRPSPSAGARHPIELVIAALNVRGLVPGLYWFDPILCRLSVLLESSNIALEVAVRAQTALATDQPPPAVICLVAELKRTLGSYVGGMSLILRDAGAFLATASLVATALGLAACPVGIGGDSPSLTALRVKYPDWSEVGAIAIGRSQSL